MQSARKDLINSIVLLVFCALAYYGTTQIPIRGVAKTEADFFPKIIIGLLLFLTICLLINSFFRWMKEEKGPLVKKSFKAGLTENKKVIVTFVLFGMYVFLLRPIGFFVSSIVFLFLLYIVLVPGKKRFIFGAIGATIITLLLYVVFRYGLTVYLPVGELF